MVSARLLGELEAENADLGLGKSLRRNLSVWKALCSVHCSMVSLSLGSSLKVP